MKTFNMTIVRDKAKPWQEDIQEICDSLRKRGMYPQGWERTRNYFKIGGNVNCDCQHKFDIMYCDKTCGCA